MAPEQRSLGVCAWTLTVTGSESIEKLLGKAVRALARRAYSRGELEARLRGNADEAEVTAVLSRLAELNLLNDAQYAYNFALWRMKQDGWGPAKVLQSLLRRRVDAPLANAAVDRVRREIGDVCLLRNYLNKYSSRHGTPQDRTSIQRLISRLQRRGFPEEVIYSVLRQVIPTAAWRCFETGD